MEAHGNAELFEIVQKGEELFELGECDALVETRIEWDGQLRTDPYVGLTDRLLHFLENGLFRLAIEVRVAQEYFSKIQIRDGLEPVRERGELDLEYFSLEILHESTEKNKKMPLPCRPLPSPHLRNSV